MYYPPVDVLAKCNDKPPILIFVYGGGYTVGDRRRSPPLDLVYANVGAFFARRGILTVIPDYRLFPSAKYPNPSEDIREALAFTISSSLAEQGNVQNIFLLGHSAGAAIIASLFLHPGLIDEGSGASKNLAKHVRGLILFGGAYTFFAPGLTNPPDFLSSFYGPDARSLEPIGLLQSASSSILSSVPPLFLLRSEKEPKALVFAHDEFVAGVTERSPGQFETYIAPGHNHISPSLTLSTGDGEEWGEAVSAWLRKRVH